jgi:group I intron endonuclease
MLINRSLLKYGYSNFQLEILEYCEPSIIIEREQYYLDILKPEYNILQKANSSLGWLRPKHSEITKFKMRRSITPENLAKIKKHLARLNSIPFPPEIRSRISSGMARFNILTKSKKLIFTNTVNNEVIKFSSYRDAALKMKMSRNTISKHLANQKLYGNYKITLDE